MKITDGILFKTKKEGFANNLLSEMEDYDKNTNELLQDYSEAINRTDVKNPLKNKNIKIELSDDSETFSEFGYVNNVGILRPYMENVDYRSTTWGKNGCPTYLSTTNVPKTRVKLNKNNLFEVETDPKLINMVFPMIPGQACGFEGENIYVDSIGELKDYTTEYKGIYSHSPNISNVDNNSNLFNYDLCKTRAIDQGMRYFGLNNYDENITNSQCVVTNNINDFNQSIMSGNIVYTSASVPPLHDGVPEKPMLFIYVLGSELRVHKVINNIWALTQILATYNTDPNDECYNNGTFNVNDIEATWGFICNQSGYSVLQNNMVDTIRESYHYRYGNDNNNVTSNYIYTIGTNNLGKNIDDVAYGCGKDFSMSYKCGNVSKIVNEEPESYGKKVELDCKNEYNNCVSILLITDDGYIYICKRSDVTITNNNFAKLNDNAKIFYTWDFSDKIDKSNNSLIYQKNFIDRVAILDPEICICSPNKKLAMTCDKSTIELVILTYSDNSVKVDNINYGLKNTSAVYEITNLPPENNVGKVAWINAMGLRKQYPSELLERSDEYVMRPGWRSVGNDIYMAKMSVEEGKDWCSNNNNCAGFEYSNNICYFKNDEMYPKGTRQPNLGGSQLYIRKKQVKTNYEYEIIPDLDSRGNDIYTATMSVEEGKKWCNNNDNCAGFEYYSGVCYFKNNEMYPKGESQPLLGGQLYIKKNKIKSTCNSKINNIDNLTWDHYIPDIFNGVFMTENYNCSNNLLNPNMGDSTNLNNNKDRLMNQLNNLDSSIFEETTKLINNTTSLNEENNFLYNSMKENFNNIQNTNQLNDITYLNTLLSNSNKFVIQKSYIIITLLVILLGLIIVLYKIKK